MKSRADYQLFKECNKMWLVGTLQIVLGFVSSQCFVCTSYEMQFMDALFHIYFNGISSRFQFVRSERFIFKSIAVTPSKRSAGMSLTSPVMRFINTYVSAFVRMTERHTCAAFANSVANRWLRLIHNCLHLYENTLIQL